MNDPHARFDAETARFRPELRAYCYRMAGAVSEADDLVQEVYLRAWRGYGAFERRASMRTWLYRIATNVCSTALQSRHARVLPSGLGPARDDDRPPTDVAAASWLEPLPEASIAPPRDPTDVVIARESLRLALVASLQYLPPRQRAILILREMLSFQADEIAAMLETTTAAVKSGLQRARARLDEVMPDPEALLEPEDPRARRLLDGYIAAFERADPTLLTEVLRADATLESTPFRDWRAGRVHCIDMLARHVFAGPGAWAMSATIANGQPAAVVHRRDAEGVLQPSGIVVLAATATGISRVVAFHHDAGLVARFEVAAVGGTPGAG